MDENINSVNAEQEVAVEPQNEVVDENVNIEPENIEEGSGEEINSQANEKPVQDTKANKAFAEMRRKAEKAERDNAIARKYGRDYGIFSEEDIKTQYGYDTMQDFEKAVEYANRGMSQDQIQQQIAYDQLYSKVQSMEHKARIQEEKAQLKGEMFFKDLEPEIDATLRNNPALDVRAVFEYIRGVKAPELLKKQTAAAQQRTLNNINGKSHIKPDGGGVEIDNITIDPEEWRIYSALNKGAKKEEYLKFKKSIRS